MSSSSTACSLDVQTESGRRDGKDVDKPLFIERTGAASEAGGRTLFWRADVVNCVIDDQLKVLLQQGVDQRGVRDTLSVCRRHTRVTWLLLQRV